MSNSVTATQSSLIKQIREHIARGERATAKAEQHFIAAGLHLATLKTGHVGTWAEWEALLKDKIRISTGRASELMQIADGRKTVEEVRAGKAESMKRLRASSPRGEETETKPKPIPPQVQREIEATQAHVEELEAAREQDQDLAERLRQAELKIIGLESEVEELKAANAELRKQLEAARATAPNSDGSDDAQSVDTARPKKRGRPPGSKNKPKLTVPVTIIKDDAGEVRTVSLQVVSAS